MKKYTLIFICLIAISFQIDAQNMPKRYVFMELFTNTPCPSCVAQNPGFFSFVNTLGDDVRLISFYPGSPYRTCPIYLANTTENAFRTSYRNLSSTPRVYINGTNGQRSGQINAADVDGLLNGESPYYLKVTENSGMSRTGTLEINTIGMAGMSNAKLFGAIVEKEVTLTGIPASWEENHHNVFRKFITAQEGMTVDLSAGPFSMPYNYNVAAEWDETEIYALFWLEDPSDNSVMNSGTAADLPFSAVNDLPQERNDIVFPNPSTTTLRINQAGFQNLTINSINGQLVQRIDGPIPSTVQIEQSGIYMVEVEKDGKKYFQKVLVK